MILNMTSYFSVYGEVVISLSKDQCFRHCEKSMIQGGRRLPAVLPDYRFPQSIKSFLFAPIVYSLALVWAFFRIGSSLVDFMMSPLILSLPDMKRRWALALPSERAWKSSSERERVTARCDC